MAKIWNYKSNKNDELSKKVEKDKTICFTKPEMAKHLISLIDMKGINSIMEPCYGDGAFFNNLPKNTKNEYCEINEGKDYLKYVGNVDLTLSNPPFVPRKLFWEFMIKAMETTNKKIYWLINLSCLNVFTPKRLEFMKINGWFFNSFHIVSDKRWFGRYAWCCFTKEDNGILTFSKIMF